MNIWTYMEQRGIKPGAHFVVTPASLQIGPEAFDALARGWLIDGGGDGFKATRMAHKESQSGRHLYDSLGLIRDPD